MITADDVRQTADGVRDAALGAIRQTAGRVSVAPLAVVLCANTVLTVPILDISQRMAVLAKAVREHGGLAFVLTYHGAVHGPEGDELTEAVFVIWLTKGGEGMATAYPYTVTPGVGIVEAPPVENPQIAQRYTEIFWPAGEKNPCGA